MAQPVYPPPYGGPPAVGDGSDPAAAYQSWQYNAPPPAAMPNMAQPLNALQPPYFDPSREPPSAVPYGAPPQSGGWRQDESHGAGYGAPSSGPRDYTAPRDNSRFDRGGSRDSRDSRSGTGGPGGDRFQRDFSGPPQGGGRFGSRDAAPPANGSDGQVENKRMIFISGLPQTVNETFIKDVFSNDADIDIFESGRAMIKIYAERGVPKGECTITYRTEDGAAKIIQLFNGQCFPGSGNIMSISYAKFSADKKGGGGRGGSFGGRGGDRGGYRDTRGGFGGDRGGGERRGYGGDRDRRDDRGSYGDRGGDRGGDRRSYGDDRRGGYGGDRDDRRSGGGYEDRGSRGGDRGGFGGGRGGDRPSYGGDRRGGFGSDRGASRGGFGDRGGSFDRGSRGGFGDRGGRGGSRGSGGNSDGRPGDWSCSCGNVNFAFRQECNSCKASKPGGGGGDSNGGGYGGAMRGPPRSGGDRHRPY